MDIPLSLIHFDMKERLRREYGQEDLVDLANNIANRGQLQDVLVRKPLPDDGDVGDCEWVLIDGGRRYLAYQLLYSKDRKVPGVEKGCVSAKIHAVDVDRTQALELEFLANEQRKDFTWKERGLLIRRVHETYMEVYRPDWSIKQTAHLLNVSKESIYKYLTLTEPETFKHPKIAEAETFIGAYKQYQIIEDKKRRDAEAAALKRLVDEMEKSGKLEGRDTGPIVDEDALKQRVFHSVWPGDVRKWMARQQDNSFDWFHWDPPYGGNQDGGATTYLEKIDDSEGYALSLMHEVIPEIYRTLRDGAWLALWYYPPYFHRIQALLQGHSYDEKGTCIHCGKHWTEQHTRCWCYAKAPFRFWVNPYPYVWYKVDRVSSDHEIKRFSINAYETFMLACKAENVEPVLPKTSTQNVIQCPLVRGKDRDHIMQKPAKVLAWILDMISVEGSRGGDGGTGSGSIFTAAFGTKRDCVGVEISENYYTISQQAAEKGLRNWGKLDL